MKELKVLKIETQDDPMNFATLYRLTLKDSKGVIKYGMGSDLGYMTKYEIVEEIITKAQENWDEEKD